MRSAIRGRLGAAKGYLDGLLRELPAADSGDMRAAYVSAAVKMLRDAIAEEGRLRAVKECQAWCRDAEASTPGEYGAGGKDVCKCGARRNQHEERHFPEQGF